MSFKPLSKDTPVNTPVQFRDPSTFGEVRLIAYVPERNMWVVHAIGAGIVLRAADGTHPGFQGWHQGDDVVIKKEEKKYMVSLWDVGDEKLSARCHIFENYPYNHNLCKEIGWKLLDKKEVVFEV